MSTLLDVRNRTRALLGDPDGDWAQDGYLDPLINQVYGQMLAYLENTCSTLQEKVVLVPGGAGANQLPPGSTNLIAFQKSGGLLYGLQSVISVEWKQAGTDPAEFDDMNRVSRLPNTSPYQSEQGVWYGRMCWEWRGEKIWFTPVQQAIDVQVRGHFRAGVLKAPDDELIDVRLLEPLASGAAAIVGVERGNQSYVLTYGGEAMNTLDDIAADLIRAEQRVPTRLARTNGQRGRGGWRR